VVIGSEMSGDVRNVAISNCVFIGTDRGIRLKSRRGRGGVVEDVRVSNLIMDAVLCPFTMNLYYHCGARGDPVVSDKNQRPVNDGTPRFRRIHISHVSAVDVKIAAGFLYGLAEMPLEDISSRSRYPPARNPVTRKWPTTSPACPGLDFSSATPAGCASSMLKSPGKPVRFSIWMIPLRQKFILNDN
jgi:polygalacturonase